MRKTITLITLLSLKAASGQCPFDPTITPNDLILCPNAQGTLTTQAYDGYQWFQDGQPITGATEQTLQVNSSQGGSQFTVSATLNGCTETSPAVLVDGWVFLLPFIIHGGDEPYDIGSQGEQLFCVGDTALLVLGLPYSENIQWTNNGMPINGATNDTLVVTGAGAWSASGAPAICPNFNQSVGVQVVTSFTPNQQPEIVVSGDELCVSPSTYPHQWYLNGSPIVADVCFAPTVSGVYTVTMDLPGPCDAPSDPADISVGVDEGMGRTDVTLSADGAAGRVRLSASAPLHGPWELVDAQGRVVQNGYFGGCTNCLIDLRGTIDGAYWLRSPAFGSRALPFAVVR